MKILTLILMNLFLVLYSGTLCAQSVVMYPGKAIGQLTILSADDVIGGSEKYKALNPLSLPVFAELPLDLSVVAGVITLKQQNINSHVQIKSRARKTPNLDISNLEGGMNNPLFASYSDGDYIEMTLALDGSIEIKKSTEQAAKDFYNSRKKVKVELSSDLTQESLMMMSEMSWLDHNKVGSKAANYAELAKALNTSDREVVRGSMAIPFSFYAQFVEQNPAVKELIKKVTRDPLMKRVKETQYREAKLNELQELIMSDESVIDENLLVSLIEKLDQFKDGSGLPRKMKLRSSTNAEDLPSFNGAGLYTSKSYKPTKDGKEKTLKKKIKSLDEAIKTVWASIWNLRAFDERNYFSIPHNQVFMGVQVNPSFKNENVDGVVVTKNILADASLPGAGVYIESQRGDFHSVANPVGGVKPERILVLYSELEPLNKDLYKVHIIQKSNIADDMETVLSHDNPAPVMLEEEIIDLTYQSLKSVEYFKPLLSKEGENFVLDIEFKVDEEDTQSRQVYLKQARPFIE